MAKDGSLVQVHTNGSVALKFVADNIYRSSACNAVMGKGRYTLVEEEEHILEKK